MKLPPISSPYYGSIYCATTIAYRLDIDRQRRMAKHEVVHCEFAFACAEPLCLMTAAYSIRHVREPDHDAVSRRRGCAGYTACPITRPGNAPLPVDWLPQPNGIAPDPPGLADRLTSLAVPGRRR